MSSVFVSVSMMTTSLFRSILNSTQRALINVMKPLWKICLIQICFRMFEEFLSPPACDVFKRFLSQQHIIFITTIATVIPADYIRIRNTFLIPEGEIRYIRCAFVEEESHTKETVRFE